jgi:hypothetical protein
MQGLATLGRSRLSTSAQSDDSPSSRCTDRGATRAIRDEALLDWCRSIVARGLAIGGELRERARVCGTWRRGLFGMGQRGGLQATGEGCGWPRHVVALSSMGRKHKFDTHRYSKQVCLMYHYEIFRHQVTKSTVILMSMLPSVTPSVLMNIGGVFSLALPVTFSPVG